ncbi:MAG: DsbA family protein [Gammaproteobacteria bacterium]|nr:DsbA family protein [Gammaproteobacteria bacterium]MDH3370361.1 DsbA family protein [Gammaproteobacteria bacterium]MDH3405718.1 DsbA family protein [Gammaproteobacteria bacterium]MDH3563608.1 DsbA family protein [Gammaproteobacteria bacterium]
MFLSLLARPATVILVCIGLLACAAPAPSPAPVPYVDSGRSSHPTGIAIRDRPIRVIEGSSLQVSFQGDPRLGDSTARIGIVEFSDYQCLFCREFHREQFPRLKQEFIETGMVRFIHKDLPLRIHAQAVQAALSAHCAAAQGRFWEMHDALFTHQGRLTPNLYLELARGLKLDEAKFKNCLENHVPEPGIREDVSLARRLGLTGTPSFLIGRIKDNTLTVSRQIRGVPAFETFAEEIEKLK